MGKGAFTMAGGLHEAGYQTASFSANPWTSVGMGLAQDFDIARLARRRELRPDRSGGRLAKSSAPDSERLSAEPEAILAAFEEWLREASREPFFAYVHFMPPHHPYVAPAEMAALFAGQSPPGYRLGSFPFLQVAQVGGPESHRTCGPELVNRYDANLRYADELVGGLIGELRDAGVFDNTLLIVTADHGEAFGEHGYNWHVPCPYDEALHIPLIVRLPGNGRGVARIAALSQTLDLLPTIYDVLGVRFPRDRVQGRSLLPLLSGDASDVHDYLFARTEGNVPCYVVRDTRYVLLLYEGGKLRALYDLESDPGQVRNVIGERPDVAERLAAAFRDFAATQIVPLSQFVDETVKPRPGPQRGKVALTDDVRKELEALGYLK